MQHFIAAIQTCFPGFGQATADGLANTQPPSVAGLMRTLINPLCRLPEPLCLVLDDLHMVHEATVHDAIACLLEQRPPRLFLMLASRREPPFSLARLRGQGQLHEIRPDDLRFTREETATFCNTLMQLDLPPAQLAMLESRTEGWIVGLQLAALSLHNNPDKAGFIRQFAGDDRHITDFLMEEVLRSRSPEMQEFLLQTSILERFSAPLCEAVTGVANGRERLDEMERGNLFLVGLDHRRQWYRYHHLFASLLQSRLRAQHPEQVEELHRRASRAYAEQGAYADAVQHAIAAGEYEQAAALMEEHSGDLFSLGRFVTALGWAWRLPPELLARHPRLSMTCAWGQVLLATTRVAEPRRLRLAMTDIRLMQAEALTAQGQAEAAAGLRQQARELGLPAGLKRRLADAGHHDSTTTDASGLAVCGMVGEVFRLSRKEKQVARHLIRGATSQEIAERLFVSLSTIKTHTKNIYAKLGVNKRLQAVEVLMKLDLA